MNFRRFSVLRRRKYSYEKVSFVTWILQSQKHNRGKFHRLRVWPHWNYFTAGLTISWNYMQQEKFQLNFSAKFVWEMQIHHVWSEYYVLLFTTMLLFLSNYGEYLGLRPSNGNCPHLDVIYQFIKLSEIWIRPKRPGLFGPIIFLGRIVLGRKVLGPNRLHPGAKAPPQETTLA